MISAVREKFVNEANDYEDGEKLKRFEKFSFVVERFSRKSKWFKGGERGMGVDCTKAII